MMRGTITSYLTRTFLTRVLSVLIALSALLQLLDLLDAASTVLERGLGGGGLVYYVLLRLPLVVERIIPLAVLIGALSTLWTFASTNEIVAMRSVGMTPYQILGALLPAAIVVALGHFLLADQLAPRVERSFVTWWAATAPPDDADDDNEPPKPIWFRMGDDVVRIGSVSDDGRHIEGVELINRDAEGRATAMLSAARGDYTKGGWQLIDVVRTRIGEPMVVTQDATLPWAIDLSPNNMIDLRKPTENLSVNRLLRIVRGTWAGGESPAYYATRLQTTYAAPLASLVMLLLAAPVAHGMRRRGGAMGALALATVIGLAFLLVSGILGAMGQAGTMPPAVAVWGPLLFFAAVGGYIMIQVEE